MYIAGGNIKWFCGGGKVWWFLNKLNTELPDDSPLPLLDVDPERTENTLKHVYTHIYSSTVHNSQVVQKDQTSINGWIDKQIMVYTHNTFKTKNRLSFPLFRNN